MQAIAKTGQCSIQCELRNIAETLESCRENKLEGSVLAAARIIKKEFCDCSLPNTEKDKMLQFAADLVCLSIEHVADTLGEVIETLDEMQEELQQREG